MSLLAQTMDNTFLEKHSAELMTLLLAAMVFGTLLILGPHLLRARLRTTEMVHAENMAAMEKGVVLPRPDDRSRAAGRTASLVPMVVICAAGTVTCFLSANKSESVLSVTLTVWSVAGVVSLAAVTGGLTLLGRLAHLRDEEELAMADHTSAGKDSGEKR